ncbi:MAG: hypothetical protein ACUVRY_03290 [Thermoanaerobaculaceae bacterium]
MAGWDEQMNLAGASSPWSSGWGYAAPLPLSQLIAQRWGSTPQFCVLRQHWQRRGRRVLLHRSTCYRVKGQPVSWHLAVLDPFRLPPYALASLLGGKNLGEVMAAMGWEREGLKVCFCCSSRAKEKGLFAGLPFGELFPGWVRIFHLPKDLGRVWELLPQQWGWPSGEEL